MSRADWIAIAALLVSLASLMGAVVLPIFLFKRGLLSTFQALSQAAEVNQDRVEEIQAHTADRMASIRAGARREPSRSFRL